MEAKYTRHVPPRPGFPPTGRYRRPSLSTIEPGYAERRLQVLVRTEPVRSEGDGMRTCSADRVARAVTAAAILTAGLPIGSGAEPAGDSGFDDTRYARILHTYVDSAGRVDYPGLKRNREVLDSVVTSIGEFSRARFSALDTASQIAFLINTYNVLALRIIVDHYLRPSLWRTLTHPNFGIRQIPGAFDGIEHRVMGEKMTLDEIEHETLRKRYNEPRIHLALVCAAKSCPHLRREPYRGPRLDAQLDDQTRRFLAGPHGLRIDREDRVVYLSPIFQWFGGDFVVSYLPEEGFGKRTDKQRAVLAFVARYVDEDAARFLRKERYRLVFLDYDWSLNEQGTAS